MFQRQSFKNIPKSEKSKSVENWPHFCSSSQPDNWSLMLIVLYRKQRQLCHKVRHGLHAWKIIKKLGKSNLGVGNFVGKLIISCSFSDVVKIPWNALLKKSSSSSKDKKGILTKQDFFPGWDTELWYQSRVNLSFGKQLRSVGFLWMKIP